jgi:hypothetical protein
VLLKYAITSSRSVCACCPSARLVTRMYDDAAFAQ